MNIFYGETLHLRQKAFFLNYSLVFNMWNNGKMPFELKVKSYTNFWKEKFSTHLGSQND